MTAGAQFPGPHAQKVPQCQTPGQGGQGLLPHQGGAHARQEMLIGLRKTLIEDLADDEPEQRIPQELQALVVASPRLRWVRA